MSKCDFQDLTHDKIFVPNLDQN